VYKNKFKEINLFLYKNDFVYKKRKKVVIKKKKNLEEKVSKFKKIDSSFARIDIKSQLNIKKDFDINPRKKNIADLLFIKYKYAKTINSIFSFKRKIKSKRKSKNKLKSVFTKSYRMKKKQVIANILKKTNNIISLKVKNKFNIYYTFFQIKKRISFLMNIQFNLYFINALSLSRYAFDKIYLNLNLNSILSLKVNEPQGQKSLSKNYLSFLQKARLLEFKNSAIYVQDRVRVSFCSLFYKKVSYIVTFFAYSMSKLPRNIKETTYIRFFIKLIKALINKREEIIGLSFRLQGRINR
jgi:hypothetical protein